MVVTGWSDAPIPWPLGLPVGGKWRPSTLVDDELARAVRTESAAAIRYWWGVSVGVVWRWRRALGVGRMDNPGSRRLIRAVSATGAAAGRGPGPTPEQAERRRLWRELNVAPRWTAAHLALLGDLPDDEVARRTGRSWNAVRQKREALGIPNPVPVCRRWTAEEDALVRSLPCEEAARRTGRSLGAVSQRRLALGIARGLAGRRRRGRQTYPPA